MTDNELLEKIHNTPQLQDIVQKYDVLVSEKRLIVLPLPFGTTLYGVRACPATSRQPHSFFSIYHFKFSATHINKINRIGTEFFTTEEEALERKWNLEEQKAKEAQKRLKENAAPGDCVLSEQYGLGQVKKRDDDNGEIIICFPEIGKDITYRLELFIKGPDLIKPKDTIA